MKHHGHRRKGKPILAALAKACNGQRMMLFVYEYIITEVDTPRINVYAL